MKKICLMWFPLVLVSCAVPSGSGRVYRQSAMPMAPEFEPVEDAPTTIGHPGYAGEPEKLPRSPYARELPPTGEPGIWAADKPKSDRPAWATREPFVYGVGLPFIPGYRENDEIQGFPRRCASQIEHVISKVAMREWFQMTIGERLCLAARLYLFCAQHDQATRDALLAEGAKMRPEWIAAIDAYVKSASGFKNRVCEPSDHATDRVKQAWTRGIERWNEELNSWKENE